MIKPLKENNDYSYFTMIQLTAIGVVIGGLSGAVNAIFGRILLFLSDFRTEHFYYLIPFLGLIGCLIVFYYKVSDSRISKGMSLLFEISQSKENSIPLTLIPVVSVATWLTHLFGGSAGREGVAVQLGATISHAFSRFFKFENSSIFFLMTGMAAGFSGLFQTPIAAIFFALEVLVVGRLPFQCLFPMTVASFVASSTSHFLGLEKFSQPVVVHLTINLTTFLKLALLGIIFGIVGNIFAGLLDFTKKKAKIILKNPYHRILIGGIVLSLLFVLCDYGRYSGLGTNLIETSFSSANIYPYDWIAKLLLTVFTLAVGFQGGEVTPLFAIGASLGVILAPLFGLSLTFVAAVGYISVFGSATNTLIAPIFIGGEIFGFSNLPFFALVMIFAYGVNRHYSIYTSQQILVLR